jgi:hypothetical protein
MLVKEYRGKFYVFKVMAESWDQENRLPVSESLANYPTQNEAMLGARHLDDTEYGTMLNVLAKDGAGVVIDE